MPRQPPIEIPAPPYLCDALMEIATTTPDGNITSVGALVRGARDALDLANLALRDNILVSLAAREVLLEHKKRGEGRLVVDANGDMLFRFGFIDRTLSYTTAPGGAGLPSMSALRALADQRGIDISDLGRQKRKIMRRLADTPQEDEVIVEDCRPPERLRDEVRTSRPLPTIKPPR
jgi:hypothetical protein